MAVGVIPCCMPALQFPASYGELARLDMLHSYGCINNTVFWFLDGALSVFRSLTLPTASFAEGRSIQLRTCILSRRTKNRQVFTGLDTYQILKAVE